MGARAAEMTQNGKTGLQGSISTKLILSFVLVIVSASAVFIVMGSQLIGDLIVAEAQDNVRRDLNTAREIYANELQQIHDVIRFTANRFFLRDAILSGEIDQFAIEFARIRRAEGLDILSVTDQYGTVLLRSNNMEQIGDDQSADALIEEVLFRNEPFAATTIVTAQELGRESAVLAERVCCKLIDTPRARASEATQVDDGMMLKAAAPILDDEGGLIGVLYGGVLLNKNYFIVDKIKDTVFEGIKYAGKDIGTATIFQGDVRIATNVRNDDGTRAIGTRVSEEVYNQVITEGSPWIGRAYVVNDWYITAYEPIRDIKQQIIGILYVGLLERRYIDIRNQTILAFMAVSLLGGIATMIMAYLISRRISVPIKHLAQASKQIAQGNLETEVEVRSKDELGDLAESFNAMATALIERDKQLKEYAARKVMESERLALIGQLAANVAHELNNPLQGIVTYSHLLLEKTPDDSPTCDSIERIVTQANRCRDIIRGLLDFSRQRKPDKTICSIDAVLAECVNFVENQASFHNIQVETDFAANLPMIIVDPSQMQQVFMNMIINAAEAMQDGGTLTLATRHHPGDSFISVEISDTGHGISEENREKIFDPFFTTKEVGQGTGLGLAISYGIVQEHKGTITVASEVGKGSTFVIRLPVKDLDEVEADG
jgi:two-component system NtrC family sensor kinase